jgi:hydrogenase maturation protease
MGSRILIAGVGNAFRGDDAAGLAVAEMLALKALPDVEIISHSGEGGSLMALWESRHAVLLIDCVQSGSTPGRIHRFVAERQCVPSDFFHYSTHAFGVAEAIELSRILGTLPAHLVVFGIEGVQFDLAGVLSPAVQVAARDVVDLVLDELVQLRQKTTPCTNSAW